MYYSGGLVLIAFKHVLLVEQLSFSTAESDCSFRDHVVRHLDDPNYLDPN